MSVLERYEKLDLRASLLKNYRYPIASKDLSFILREAYHQLPKILQSIVFQDTLTAFRLVPQIQNQNAVSAAHFLLLSAEVTLPKQKKNMAVKEFKHAMLARKRCSKTNQVEKGSFQLPQDILVHIFSFLDMQSLILAGIVCWTWNHAANDNYLWELQHVKLYGSAAKQEPRGLVEDGNNNLLQKTTNTGTITDWKESVKEAYTEALSKKLTTNRGYCERCKTIVWLNNTKCPNVPCATTSEIQDVKPVTSFQVVEYLLSDSFTIYSSSDSDSDSDGEVFGIWAFPKHLRKY